MAQVRVLLQPTIALSTRGTRIVTGARVALTRMGTGTTSASRGAAQPAALSFHIAFLERVRGQPQRSFSRVATITGTLQLTGPGGTPVFTGDGSEITYDAPPTDERSARLRRTVKLRFDSASFREMVDPDESELNLLLPEEPELARYAEIDTELTIDAQPEAALGSSDILDIALVQHSAEVRLFDGNGNVLPGVRYEAEIAGEVISNGVTDENGIAIVAGLRGERSCVIRWASTQTGVLHFEQTVTLVRSKSTGVFLGNLGYSEHEGEQERMSEVLDEYGMGSTGVGSRVRDFLRVWHDDGQVIVPEGTDPEAVAENSFSAEELESEAEWP